jgi:branched-chain amino acid transport system ATP-binding protein
MEKYKSLLNVEKLEVVYHNVSLAVQGISFEVKNQQIVAILGSNGAGKTTTLRAISGFLGIDCAKVANGIIKYKGEEIQNKPPYLITKKGIVLVPEREKIFETLTVEENLQISAPVSKSKENVKYFYDLIYHYFPILAKVKNRLGGYLSGGEKQMLSISSALLCEPELLLVDELSLGLGPIIVSELMNLVKRIRDDLKVTILLVEQNALAALEIADFGYILENGHIVYGGDSIELINNRDIQEYYLGQNNIESRRSYREVKQYKYIRKWYG